jgi:hypothetical protein
MQEPKTTKKTKRIPRRPVGVRFSPLTLAAISRISKRTGEAPTAVIRRLIEEQLFGKERAA